MEFWDDLKLDVELPTVCDTDQEYTCLTELWNQYMCDVPLSHITTSPPISPTDEPVNAVVTAVFGSVCSDHATIDVDDLLAEFRLLQRSSDYMHVRELSLKVIAAGAAHACALRRYGVCLATKDICAACSLTGPTVRKAISVFSGLFFSE